MLIEERRGREAAAFRDLRAAGIRARGFRSCAGPGVFARPESARVDSGLRQLREPRDLGEPDHRDDVVLRDLSVVELAEEAGELVNPAELGVVMLDLPR